MAFPYGRIGLLGGANYEKAHQQSKRGTCNLASGDLYMYPNSTSTVDATSPVTFKWNTGCSMDSHVDLYLYDSSSQNGLIQVWQNAPYSDGQYTAILRPKWWNDTTSANLQLSIINSGQPSWETASPPGPVFKVTYPADKMYTTQTVNGQVQTSTAAAAATGSHDAIFQDVTSNGQDKGLSKGAIAAAVIVPIIALAIIAGVAVQFWRRREQEKRKRWSQALSSHSNLEWEKGALPGERRGSVFAGQGGRPGSQFSSGRPMSQFSRAPSHATSSVYAVENNMAGAGAIPRPSFAQYRSQSVDNLSRSSIALPDGSVRQSRISFAETTRGDRRSRLSMGDGGLSRPGMMRSHGSSDGLKNAAYATGSAIADDHDDGVNVSPSQLHGPAGFGDNDLNRMANGKRTGRKSFLGGSRRNSTNSVVSADDFRAASSTGGSVDELRDMENTVLARRSMISEGSSMPSPAPYAQHSHDRIEALDGDMPTQPKPTAGQSTVAYGPDQMLAVYAARGKVSATPGPSNSMAQGGPIGAPAPGDMKSYVHLNFPQPGHNSNNGTHLAAPGVVGNDSRMSTASGASAYSEEDVGAAK